MGRAWGFSLESGLGGKAGLFESKEPAIGHEASALGGVVELGSLGVGPALIEEDEFAGRLEGRGDNTEFLDGRIGGDADPYQEREDYEGMLLENVWIYVLRGCGCQSLAAWRMRREPEAGSSWAVLTGESKIMVARFSRANLGQVGRPGALGVPRRAKAAQALARWRESGSAAG